MKGGDVGERGEEAIHCSGSGWGKGCGQAAIATARDLALSSTRMREVRPAQRMDE